MSLALTRPVRRQARHGRGALDARACARPGRAAAGRSPSPARVVGERASGSAIWNERTPSGSKPGSTCWSSQKLRISRPPPITRVAAKATSTITSTRRSNWRPAPAVVRWPPSLSEAKNAPRPGVEGRRQPEEHAGQERHAEGEEQAPRHRRRSRPPAAGFPGSRPRWP